MSYRHINDPNDPPIWFGRILGVIFLLLVFGVFASRAW